ncbi:UNVERIFIED_CONTAM: hypothetical protein RMT77_001608 [Armadillidium vulgare]
MEHYEIKPINDIKKKTENLPREGLVSEVCREWLMHEDQALAYRLQSEEYQHHLGHNRERNAILRKDTPRAREEQLREDEESARAQTQIEIELAEQERRDAALAAAIGAELDRKEHEKERLQELKDRQLAKKLIEEEKIKMRQKKELRQVEREAAYLGINSGSDNVAILARKDKRSSVAIPVDESSRRAASPNENDLTDLSDFCIKPSSSMDEDEMRRLQEDQDEELARLLQEQDLKRRGDLLQQDKLSAIEAQDKELAKILQEQERAKAKKAREKARQKALLKQPENPPQALEQEPIEKSPPPRPPKPMSPPPREESPRLGESPQYAAIMPPRRPNSPQYASPMFLRGSSDPGVSSTPSPQTSPTKRYRSPSDNERIVNEKTPPYTPSSLAFPNIACAIDPTYERRVKQGELSPASTLSSPNRLSTHSSSSKSPISPPVFEEECVDDEEDYLPPPYMPIQGQRRTASLEKRKGITKPIKDKVDKNGCKQQ